MGGGLWWLDRLGLVRIEAEQLRRLGRRQAVEDKERSKHQDRQLVVDTKVSWTAVAVGSRQAQVAVEVAVASRRQLRCYKITDW